MDGKFIFITTSTMDFTALLEKLLPDYHKSQSILELDILTRYFNNEEVDVDDLLRIESLGDRDDLHRYYQYIIESLYVRCITYMQNILGDVNNMLQIIYDDSTLGDIPVIQNKIKTLL